jgi:hypothetical protein
LYDIGSTYCKSAVQSTHGIEVRIARAEDCLVYWDLAPVAELNGQIGPVWILEPTATRVIRSVQDKFRRLSITHDCMVSCGDKDAIIVAELEGALLVRLLGDVVMVVELRRLFILRRMRGKRVM